MGRTVLLFVFAASIPITDLSRFYLGAGSVAELLVPALLVAAFVHVTTGPAVARRALLSPTTACVAVWLLFGTMSWLASGAEKGVEYVRIVEYALVYVAICVLATSSRASRGLVAGLTWGGVAAAALCFAHWILGAHHPLFQQWAGIEEGWYYTEDNFRVHGPFGNPLNTAMYLSTLVGLMYVRATDGPARQRWVRGGLTAFVLFASQLTGSKTSLMAPVVLLVLERRFKILAFVAVIGVAALLLGAFDTLILRIVVRETLVVSFMQRIYVLGSALAMIFSHPLLGVGPGLFPDHYAAFKHPNASLQLSSFTAENLVLQYAAEIGVIGAAALLAACVTAWRTPRSPNVVRASWLPGADRVGIRAVSVGLLIYGVVSTIQSSTSADLSMLLFALIGFQQGQRARAGRPSVLPRLAAPPALAA